MGGMPSTRGVNIRSLLWTYPDPGSHVEKDEWIFSVVHSNAGKHLTANICHYLFIFYMFLTNYPHCKRELMFALVTFFYSILSLNFFCHNSFLGLELFNFAGL